MRRLHRWWWAVGCVLLLSGCVSTDAPTKDALRRFGETGKAVTPMLRAPADPSEEALQDAFKMSVDECLKVR